MFRLHRLKSAFHSFFLKYYHFITFFSISLAATTGFFHIQWKYRNRDFLYWTQTFHELYKQYEYLFIVVTAAVLLIKLLIAFFLFAINTGPVEWFEDLTRLEVKKRYADFLFIRLVSEISQIKDREMRNRTIISISSFIKAHEEIQDKIAKFRKDARKLFAPNEIEISLPPEEIYDVDSDPLDKKFAHIKVDEVLIKKMINP